MHEIATRDREEGLRWLKSLWRWVAADHADLPEPERPEAIDWARAEAALRRAMVRMRVAGR